MGKKVVPVRACMTPESLLDAAKTWRGGLVDVVIVGIDSSGDVVSGTTLGSAGDVLMALSIESKRQIEFCDQAGFLVEECPAPPTTAEVKAQLSKDFDEFVKNNVPND